MKTKAKKFDPGSANGRWVTINGNHVFIEGGKSVRQSLNEKVKAYEQKMSDEESKKGKTNLRDWLKRFKETTSDDSEYEDLLLELDESDLNKLFEAGKIDDDDCQRWHNMKSATDYYAQQFLMFEYPYYEQEAKKKRKEKMSLNFDPWVKKTSTKKRKK